MRNSATQHPPPPGTGGIGPTAIAAAGALGLLKELVELVRRISGGLEREPSYDSTWVVGGVPGAAGVVLINLPRTLKHVQVELTAALSPTTSLVALFAGNLTVAQAQAQFAIQAGLGQSSCLCCSNGGTVKTREFLDGSGYLTVLFTGAFANYGWANVRIRELDSEQANARRD